MVKSRSFKVRSINALLLNYPVKLIFFILSMGLIFIYFIVVIHSQSYTWLSINLPHSNYSLKRIYCFILTSPKHFDTKTRAVNLTWAPRCDKYHFISEYANDTKGLPIAPIANITPGYNHLTQKTTLAFFYAYQHFINEFDWFLKADDDTYIFVDNLQAFLNTQNPFEPITFGYNFKVIVSKGYHSGGAGYVLSRESLRRFYQAHHEVNSSCAKDLGPEDVEIARCLRKKGVYMGNSTDRYNRERFHASSFKDHFNNPPADWLFTYSENKPVTGWNCCSDGTISFHRVSADDQYLIDRMHYGFHNKDT